MTVAELLRLSEDSRSELGLVEAVRRGLPIAAVDAVVDAGLLEPEEVDRLVAPREELAGRRGRNERLSPAESDRVVSIARVLIVAAENFGEGQKAGRWLRAPNRALGGAIPLELLDTGEGSRLVEESILRLAHGIFA